MGRRHPAIAIVLVCALLLSGRVARGQDTTSGDTMRPHPLLALLALTPDEPFVAQGSPFLRYTDYDAIRDAFPAVSQYATKPVTSHAALCWFDRREDPAVAHAQPGIDSHQIERALAFGNPPASGVILEGDFEAVTLAQALDASGYTQRDEQGILLLQPETGLSNPDGWRDSVAIAGRYLMRTPKPALLEDLVNAYIGYRQSLYTRPAVLALAEALAREPGEMLRAVFFYPEAGQSGIPKSAVSAFEVGQYGLAALAHYRADGVWLTTYAQVYEAQSSARVAARMLVEEAQPGVQHVTDIRVDPPLVYASPSGDYFVALARVRHRRSVCGTVAGRLSEEAQK